MSQMPATRLLLGRVEIHIGRLDTILRANVTFADHT